LPYCIVILNKVVPEFQLDGKTGRGLNVNYKN